jgi:hypothetical protein
VLYGLPRAAEALADLAQAVALSPQRDGFLELARRNARMAQVAADAALLQAVEQKDVASERRHRNAPRSFASSARAVSRDDTGAGSCGTQRYAAAFSRG